MENVCNERRLKYARPCQLNSLGPCQPYFDIGELMPSVQTGIHYVLKTFNCVGY